MRLAFLILIVISFVGCNYGETEDVIILKNVYAPIEEKEGLAGLVYEANCGKMNYKVYYDSLRHLPNPFGKAIIRVVAENKNGDISEFRDSSDENYSFLMFDYSAITVGNCEDETPYFYTFYEILNDDNASLNIVVHINDSILTYEAWWTPDGDYFALDKSIYEEILVIKKDKYC